MDSKKIILISFLIGFLNGAPTPTYNYTNFLTLVEPDVYYLYWTYTNSDILFEIHVKANGWAGFGISPNYASMFNSDMIVTFLNNDGSANFTDRNTKSALATPSIDSKQNWFNLLTQSKDGYLISKFTRKIKLCDPTGDDLDIDVGTPFVIFAYSNDKPVGDISYHGMTNRGSKAVPLISSLNKKLNIDMSQVELAEFKVNVREKASI